MSKRKKSLRAAARARYRKAAAEDESPTRRASPAGLPLAGGGSRAVQTPLTRQARALYEGTVVPVREIARLAGVSERTLYKYVQRGGWRRRHRLVARDAAAAVADRGRRLPPRPGLAPATGAGGRFVRREQADLPHAAGLGALDPIGEATAAAACVHAGALSEAALAEASADAQAREARELAEKKARVALRTLDHLSAALIDLVRQRRARPEGAVPAADRLDALLQDAILAQIGRLLAR